MSVCVCLSASISPKLHVESARSYFCLLTMAVARSSSGGVAIFCVLPVSGMTSYLHIMGCIETTVDTVAANDVTASSCAG